MNFIIVHDALMGGVETFVNLNQVITINKLPNDQAHIITSQSGDYINTTETYEEVLSMIDPKKNHLEYLRYPILVAMEKYTHTYEKDIEKEKTYLKQKYSKPSCMVSVQFETFKFLTDKTIIGIFSVSVQHYSSESRLDVFYEAVILK